MIINYRENEKQLKSLFREIFLESEEFTNLIFEKKLSESDIFAIKEKNEIVSFAYGIHFDCKINNIFKKCVYIYAVGVRKEHRGKGLAGDIMNEIYEYYKDKNISFLYLVPANESLFQMYKKMGYDTVISLYYKNFNLDDISCVPYKLSDGDFKKDYKKYTENKNDFIVRSENDNEILLSYLKYKKVNESGFLYYTDKKERKAIVRESFIYDENDLLGFLSYLKENDIKNAEITNVKENKRSYAMARKYEKTNLENIYTNVNFD